MKKPILGFWAGAAWLLLPACSPDMQPVYFCAPDQTVPYLESPAELRTDHVVQVVDAYVALGGEWSGQLQCPVGCPNSGPVVVSIQTDTTDRMLMVVGPDKSQPGVDCGSGTVLAGGQITITGASIGGLSGETATMDAKIGGKAIVIFSFDATYDPGLETVDGLIIIQSDLSFQGIITFAKQPKRNSDGSYTQEGYDCGLELVARL
jgi:hypothetical protein